MTKSNLFKPAFLMSLLVILLGVIFKLMHLPGVQTLIFIGVILNVAYIILALYEIYSSSRITTNEKIMWTVGFIVLSLISGLLYFFWGRRRILRDYKLLKPENL